MGGFFEGDPYQYFNNLPQYQKDLQAGTSGLALQQLGQPNTAMPAQMYQDVMKAYAPNQSMYDALGIVYNMMTGQPGTNASLPVMMSNYQPTGQTLDYSWDSGDSGRNTNPDNNTYNFNSGVGVDLIVDDDGNPIYRNRFNPTRNG